MQKFRRMLFDIGLISYMVGLGGYLFPVLLSDVRDNKPLEYSDFNIWIIVGITMAFVVWCIIIAEAKIVYDKPKGD